MTAVWVALAAVALFLALLLLGALGRIADAIEAQNRHYRIGEIDKH